MNTSNSKRAAEDEEKSKSKIMQTSSIVGARHSSFFVWRRQMAALIWKQLLLLRRHPVATIFELVLSVGFVAMLLAVRHVVECTRVAEQSTSAYFVVDYFQTLPGRHLILYHPDTPIVKQVVMNAYNVIRTRKLWLNAIG
jgi:hypothetical protein